MPIQTVFHEALEFPQVIVVSATVRFAHAIGKPYITPRPAPRGLKWLRVDRPAYIHICRCFQCQASFWRGSLRTFPNGVKKDGDVLSFISTFVETTMSSDDVAYDIIFVGGGTTACIIASRLAKADPSLRILILEAGPHTQETPDHIIPGRFFRNLIRGAPTFSFHVSQPIEALGGRPVIVSAGRCIGGGSSVNWMMYTRAAASDYDDWDVVHGNPGWGSDQLIPLLKKAETFQALGDSEIHGTTGPIKVSYTADQHSVGTEFLDAAREYDKERPQITDTNDFYNCNGYGRWPRYIDSVTGRRSDVAHNYIYNQSFKNMEVLTGRRVLRVLFENNRAVGVEHVDDVPGRAKQNTTSAISYASRLIVISAGAFGSPAVLERSGIGATSVLEPLGITQIVDLPGVGENYMDHNGILTCYNADEGADTVDVAFKGEETEIESFMSEWTQTGKGLMSHNGIDAGIKIRPDADDLKTMPEFEERWRTFFTNSLDKPAMWIGTMAWCLANDPAAGQGKFYSVTPLLAYPSSTGRVHIQSGTDAYAPLKFHPGFLNEVADIAVLRWGYKHSRELARRMASYRGELISTHPRFLEGSDATCKVSGKPVDPTAPNINYTEEDDKAIDAYIRDHVGTTHHSCGTCGMKPREKDGVVDPRLNVYGVQGLKVADLSIMPSNVGANTYNTALAIGEKAALIIAEDLGITGYTM